MATQLSVAARNAMLDGVETAIGASPLLRMRTGGPPANCAAADTGSVIAEMTLPADAWAAASGGTKVKSGTWQDLAANAQGTIAHYRIYDATGTTCHLQGTVTITGGGGDMTVDNPVVEVGQPITVTAHQLNAGNA